jgi:UDP:flavonoid glycosyltransferase YjiC (YdhE family)
LILSWDGGGNSPPAFNLGSRLVRYGHRVRLMGWSPMAARAAAAGLEFAWYPSLPDWPSDVAFDDDWQRINHYLAGTGCRDDIRAEIRASGADLVVVDCMLQAGFDAVRMVGVPHVALMHVSYQQFMQVWGDETVQRAVTAEADLVLATQPPGFDLPCPMPAGHEYVGIIGYPGHRVLDPALASALTSPGDPWVLVSLSTTTQPGQRDALAAIVSGTAGLPVRVLLTLAGGVAPGSLAVPDNVTVCGYVPHELVLPHVAAFVNHAGMCGIATALDIGVPMVCIPQGRDQGGNAARVTAIGAGLAAPSHAVADEFVPALVAVLTDDRFGRAARAISRGAAGLRSGGYAAGLVDAVACSNSAVAIA